MRWDFKRSELLEASANREMAIDKTKAHEVFEHSLKAMESDGKKPYQLDWECLRYTTYFIDHYMKIALLFYDDKGNLILTLDDALEFRGYDDPFFWKKNEIRTSTLMCLFTLNNASERKEGAVNAILDARKHASVNSYDSVTAKDFYSSVAKISTYYFVTYRALNSGIITREETIEGFETWCCMCRSALQGFIEAIDDMLKALWAVEDTEFPNEDFNFLNCAVLILMTYFCEYSDKPIPTIELGDNPAETFMKLFNTNTSGLLRLAEMTLVKQPELTFPEDIDD